MFFSDAPSAQPQESRQERYLSGNNGAFGAFPPQGAQHHQWDAGSSLGHKTGNLAFSRHEGVDPTA